MAAALESRGSPRFERSFFVDATDRSRGDRDYCASKSLIHDTSGNGC